MLFAVSDDVWKYLIDHALPWVLAIAAAISEYLRRKEKEKNEDDRRKLGNMIGANRRRGTVAAVRDRLVEIVNGQMYLTTRGREVMAPVQEVISSWYAKEGHVLHTDELFMALIERFDPILTEKVCLPHELTDFQCYSAAIALCRETHVVGNRPKPPSWRPSETATGQGDTSEANQNRPPLTTGDKS